MESFGMWNYQQPSGLTQQFEKKEAKKLYQKGELLPTTPVWNKDMGSWLPACQTELAEIFPEDQKLQALDQLNSVEHNTPNTFSENFPYQFRDPEARMRRVHQGLKVFIVGSVLWCAGNLGTILLQGNLAKTLAAMGMFFGSILFLIGLIFSGVSFIRWTKYLSENAHAMSARRLTSSPTYAAWSYIIPIVSLWIPRAAIAESWKASFEKSQRGSAPDSALLNIWWVSYIAWGSLQNVTGRLELGEDVSLAIDSGVIALGIFTAYTAMRVVKSATSPQLAYRDTLAPESNRAY